MKEVEDLNGLNKKYSKNMPYIEKLYHAKEMSQKYALGIGSAWSNSFLGKNYKKIDFLNGKMNSYDGLSIERTAGESIASLALLMEKDNNGKPKYTLEQIMDPNALNEEKERIYDTIIKKTGEDSKEAREYIGNLIYNGLKNGSEIMDRMTEALDLDDPTLELSDDFQKLGALSSIMYDSWQEIARKEDMLLENVKKDNPEITDNRSAYEYTKNKFCGPFTLWTAETGRYINETINYMEKKESMDSQALVAAFNIQMMKNFLKDCRKSGIPASDYYLANNIQTKANNINVSFSVFANEWGSELYFNKEARDSFYSLARTGEIFRYTTATATYNEKIDNYDVTYQNLPEYNNKKKIFEVKVPKRSEKQRSEKLPVGFDSYIKLHTGKNAASGENDKDKCKTIAKVLAAYSLKKLGKKFSVKDIHRISEHIADIYMIRPDMIRGVDLDQVLKSKKNILRFGEERREKYYSIKPENYDAFVDEMKKIQENMISEKGHSDGYKAFAKAVKNAASLNDIKNDMTPEEKAEAFRNASLEVMYAADKYMKGKEKIRWGQEGKDCFNNALDALAAVSRNTPKDKGQPINIKIADIIGRIQKIRNDGASSLNMLTFEDSYGGTRAAARRNEINAAKNKSNINKPIKK